MADNLDSNATDRFVALSKAAFGFCPVIGPIASEAVGVLIPNQRVDRVVDFLRALETEVVALDARLEAFSSNLREPEGLGIIEEGIVQASRSVTHERKQWLARLVAKSLTGKELKYAESAKLLNLFRELTEPEILWLISYSLWRNPDKGPHRALVEKHPEVLKSASPPLASSQEQVDRAALQESYKNTLMRLGLIVPTKLSSEISALGFLLLRYIEGQYEDEHES